MKSRISCLAKLTSSIFFVGVTLCVFATDHPVAKMQMELAKKRIAENKVKVQNALKEASLPSDKVVYYVVPAMSDIMRVGDVYPADGHLNGELRAVLAKNEFEPASFQLYSFTDRDKVQLSVSSLKGPNGAVISEKNLDLKVVKLWYQNGNGWVSYFADNGLKLIPELLLHDENMIKVDTQEIANYARIQDKGGARYEWISAARELDGRTFRPVAEQFMDADTIQPVKLNAGEFKQFFLTVHAPKDQAEGVYRGVVTVSSGNQKLAEIPVAVRVLPFELPLPKTYYDVDKPFIVSFMGGTNLERLVRDCGGDKKFAEELYRKYLTSQFNHGIFHPALDQTEEAFKLMREIGFETKPLMGRNLVPWFALNFGGRMRFDNYMAAKDAARRTSEFYNEHFGHNDVLVSYGDEQGAAFVVTHRGFHRYLMEYGIMIGCAGHDALLYKGGYAYQVHPMGGAPDATDRIRPWNEMGGKYVGFYADQHTGPENPEFIRRQHGLLGYFSNLSMVYNYEFALGPWNDLASELYKPMVVSYLNRGGLVDTLQYEGFREGIDDMRYATKLKQLCRDAMNSGDVERKLEAGKALQYMALLEADKMDLNNVRAEMINYILKLMSMEGGK